MLKIALEQCCVSRLRQNVLTLYSRAEDDLNLCDLLLQFIFFPGTVVFRPGALAASVV